MQISAPTLSFSRPPSLRLASSSSAFFTDAHTAAFTRRVGTGSLALAPRTRATGPARRRFSCKCIFGLGVPELVVIAGVAALVFGPKKLPEVGRSIGKTVKSFQQAAKEFESELKKEPDSAIESPVEQPTTVSVVEKQDVEVSSTKESS